ncbi:MAG: transglutaminase family protein [Pseudomonadota bacterium]
MTLRVALTHKTDYHYNKPINLGPQVIRLKPAPHTRTPIVSYSLTLKPDDHFLNWQQDPFGNFMARMVTTEKTEIFSIHVDLVAEMSIINPFDFLVDDTAKQWPFKYTDDLKKDLEAYLTPMTQSPELTAYVKGLDIKADTTLDFLVALNQKLEQDIDYIIRMEPGVQTPAETLKKRKGSCRDSGWLLVEILRNLGFASRFCSGYLIQLTPDVKALDGPTGTDHDFTDLHAWTEVYLPGAGWIGLDPTSGLLTGEGHIPLAATPHHSSAAPISGTLDPAEVTFDFDMKVSRILETPRVTKPYTEQQWQDITKLGHHVDKHLVAGDVRLTMGGEPTFVSAEDMEGDEWNTAAVGPTKRQYAENLIRRLYKRFAPGGLLHFGQGKWYPGEQLPRWAFSLYWRSDGEALWENPELIDSEIPKKQATIDDAKAFSKELCSQLGLPEDSGIPAYEDQTHFLLCEQKLPINLDISDNKLEDESERARMVRVYDQGLSTPTSYVLPIQAWQTKDKGRRWVTERWQLRREKLFLMPGDSPAGFRLPLGSLPYISPVNYPHVLPRDPFEQRRPLPRRTELLHQRRTVTLEASATTSAVSNEILGSVRTALTIEPRNGHLCIFLPPQADAEDTAALLRAIEETSVQLDRPIHIEGYEPASDPRFNVIKVTPDPGVIEVNIQPAHDWDHAVDITTALYEEAHLCRLGTEKFKIDGKHSGTGGGNHIVLGGPTPNDSPFVRRPDLLSSIIAYWQNHPSLSYLFSGQFIGPTSQAPRVDEARHEQLYELEIAMQSIPEPGQHPIPPWLVDRSFRNLLTDVTGNTHRAEICIDKLYSPDGPNGRLGLVEFRSFEMPPHAQMSLAQQLLLRALIAWFWEKPYKQKLVRWGTQLHDQFMLLHFVSADFQDVLQDLNSSGFALQKDWFDPHFEFRFPHIGTVHYDNMTLELRQALEPWHVLGEEGGVSGTARYVDSSLERLQVHVSGIAGDRYRLACNGIEVPLKQTCIQSQAVSGIRFRAWQPTASLHPTIGIHAPLTFDLYDTWSGRAIGGCRYHVSHPGGKYFETIPVNSYEAEGRRLALFEEQGHTTGNITLQKAPENPEYPHTLDLRLL